MSDDSINIDLSDCYDSSNTGYIASLFHDSAKIIGTSGFSSDYSNLSIAYTNKKFFSVLTISDFNNVSDYYSSFSCIPSGNDGKNEVAACLILYSKLFFNHDIENRQLIAQGKIADKYGVDGGDAAISPKAEDELWFYSFFDDEIPFSYENGTFAVNYRYETDDFTQYGYNVYSDLKTSTEQFENYFANSPSLITLNKLIFIIFDGQTDTRLCEFIYDRSENNTFKLSVNYLNSDFQEGVLKKYNEDK